MLELDECDQILVTNPFADDNSSTVSSSSNHDAFVTLTSNSSSEHHPLRTRSVSPAHRCNTQSLPSVVVIGSEGEARPRLTKLLSSDGVSANVAAAAGEHRTTGSDDSAIVVHPVRPNDSLAGVALRYGVSIAALRRANQLWPSDPIHLRTQLLIPRGDTLYAMRRSTHRTSTDTSHTTLRSTAASTPSLSPDLVVSSFVSARNMIISLLPAHISMESLNSKASASEDHELDDFRNARAREMSATGTPFAEEGYELSILAAPRAHFQRSGVPLSSQAPHSPTHKHPGDDHVPPVGDLHSRCVSSSSTASLEPRSRARPFAVLPVRTSQLEPEPAMELPARRPRIQRFSFSDVRCTTSTRSNAFK